MDERDMEEEEYNREGKGREIGINMFFFFGIALLYLKKNVISNLKTRKKSKKFLFERISLAIQRGNAASIRGTFPDSAILSEIFVL
jgi:hypothetical protein